MSAEWVAAWLRASAGAVAAEADWFTSLDAAIGDGDHGINLARGFGRVLDVLDGPGVADLDAGDLLVAAGRAIMGSVGGASGALYGRALLRAGAAVSRQAGTDAPPGDPPASDGPLTAVTLAMDAAVDAIATLGRSAPGDKTMLDALVPAARAAHDGLDAGDPLDRALSRMAEAAQAGLESTRPLVARRGRASYLGERSAGHLDPGAASAALLIRVLSETARAG